MIKKKQYNENPINNLRNARNPSKFWKAINKFRRKNTTSNNADTETWKNFLNQLFPLESTPIHIHNTILNDILDKPILLREITKSIIYK